MPQSVLGIFFVLFALVTCGLLLRSLSFLYLFLVFRKYTDKSVKPEAFYSASDLPIQIVQLPIYNEDPEMVKALIDSACSLKYSRDRLRIQILDDSDQENISQSIIEHLSLCRAQDPDLRIDYLHRPARTAYKAGNLNHGLDVAKQALKEEHLIDYDHIIVSIFDADFLIPDDYLQQTVHYFTSPEICAVQTSINYLNANDNLLTRVQAAYLSNLHLIDFASRSHSGHMSTFRGSAGSWRLSAIEACGGWSGDTQVEDVDMSITVQLSGLSILYLDQISVWSRLPGSYDGFKLQQRSWMKGIMEVFRKHIMGILKNKTMGPFQKAMAVELFLILSLQPLYIIAHHILALPAYYFMLHLGISDWLGYLAVALVIMFNISHIPFLRARLAVNRTEKIPGQSVFLPLRELVFSIFITLGMFATFSYGIVEGLLGLKVHREPTQKSGSVSSAGPGFPPSQRLILRQISLLEFTLVIYSIFFATWAVYNSEWAILLLYGPFALGYPWVAVHSLMEMISIADTASRRDSL